MLSLPIYPEMTREEQDRGDRRDRRVLRRGGEAGVASGVDDCRVTDTTASQIHEVATQLR